MLTRLARWWPGLVLLAELLVFYRKVIFQPGAYVIPWDFQYYHYNLAQYLAASLHAGRFPLWDPYTYCGMPFFAMSQAQVFYVPAVLTALLASMLGLDHLLWLQTLYLTAHVLVAGGATYWLLRTLGTSRLAALTGGTAFQLGCYFASQTQHLGAITGAAAVPLSALAVVKLAERPGRRWMAVLAGSLAVSILTGFPSTAAVVILCSSLLVVGLVWSRRARAPLLMHYIAGLCLGVALSAIQLIPAIQAAALSVSKYRADARTESGIRLEALPSLLWPNYFHILDLRGYTLRYNFTFLYLYCGIAVMVLAGSALFGKRNRYTVPFALVLLVSAIVMHGDATPLGRILNPWLLNLTHDSVYPEYFMAGFSFGVAVLAGLGADRLTSRPLLLTCLLLFTICELTLAGSGRPMNTKPLRDEPGITPRQFDGRVEILETVRQRVDRSNPPARIDTYGDSLGWAMMAPTTRIPTANGDDPFALETIMGVRRLFCGGERWGRYYEVARLDSPILDLLNIQYLTSRNALPTGHKYRLAAQMPGHLLYENGHALPRFFVVRKTLAAADMQRALTAMAAPDFNPAGTAVVQDLPGRSYAGPTDAPVRVISYAPESVVLAVDPGAGGGFLVTSEANYPGWRATLDGSSARIIMTNAAFRGVELPAGPHRLVFRFHPMALWWGGGVSALTFAGMCFALFGRRRGKVE